MRIDWDACSERSLHLFLGTSILAIVWSYLKWPWAGFVRAFPMLFAAGAFLASHYVKQERLRKKQLREEIRSLSNDLTLRGDFTIDEFDLLYEIDELGRIITALRAMPDDQRKLQAAVDLLDLWEKSE